jgi:hypothetical protein
VWYAVFPAWPSAASGGPAYASLARVLPRILAPVEGSVSGRRVRFAWRAAAGARYYNVQVWNRGVTRRVLTRWPDARQVVLRLPPGRYRWYVYPGFGTRTTTRYGALIGQGSFTVR